MENTQEDLANTLARNELLLKAAVKALEEISLLGGNLSDEALMSRTGSNDAVARGIMYTGARGIAKSFLGLQIELSEKAKKFT